jgi:hypothetical protein
MRTIYKFDLDHCAQPELRPALLCCHIEHILLLGYFSDDTGRLKPTHLSLPRSDAGQFQPLRLFQNPRAHLWRPSNVITTKAQLFTLRQQRTTDVSYDIDVLRMSEPRILFILSTLQLINQLETTDRVSVFRSLHSLLGAPHFMEQPSTISAAFSCHLSNILGIATLMTAASALEPSHYRFHQLPSIDAPLEVRPRLLSDDIFAGFLRAFSQLIDVTFEGTYISSFELRSYDHWTKPSNGDPFEVLGTLSRDCNAKCDFCYVKGNPSDTAIKLPRFSLKHSAEEAEIRLSYFQRGLMLPIPTYDTEEITIHPRFLDICRGIREQSSKCISLTTNGYRLTEDFLGQLLEYSPIDVSLSLNAASPTVRNWLMGGASARGLEALSLLHKYRVPCAVTLAAWPRVPISEYIDAIRYIDQFNVRSISILLGGFTRLFPDPPDYPMPGFWNIMIDNIAPLRAEISTPLILQPRLYEEQYRLPQTLGASIITGINKYSPAAESGLNIYDEILTVEGVRMATRNQCLSLLSLLRRDRRSIQLEIGRSGRVVCLRLQGDYLHDDYLYDLPFNDRYGIHLIGENIRLRSIRDIFSVVDRYGAKRVLFLTSMIVRPLLAKLLKELSVLSGGKNIEFDLQIPQNRFLGGNIVMGDMLVLDDFLEFIEGYARDNGAPDLILLPSGPFNHGGWSRDMKGQPFELLRHFVESPIEMIEAPYFE